MREIFYKYSNLGAYYTDDNTSFGEDTQLKIIIEPHDFSIALSGEVLRSTSFVGCSVIASRQGEAAFYGKDDDLMAKADAGADTYKQVKLVWKKDSLSILFGSVTTVDNYPNCDGEHDRWSEEWVTERSVTLKLKDNSVDIE